MDNRNNYDSLSDKVSLILKKVYATQDDSGHWYVIPFEMKDKFFELEEKIGGENSIAADESDEEFSKLFSQYKINTLKNKIMIQEVIMYNAKCDDCGIEAEFGDFTCYGDKDSVRTDIDAQGWDITDDDHCYCEDCKQSHTQE